MIIVSCKDQIDYPIQSINYGPFASVSEAKEWIQDTCNHLIVEIINLAELEEPSQNEKTEQLKFPW